MNSEPERRVSAYIVVFAGLTVALAACSGGGTESPTTPATSTTSTTTPSTPSSTPPSPLTPTEKSINPTGGNLFTPDVKAPGPQAPAPGNLPGNHPDRG
ncbi:MAG: hypothetical protein JST91_02770 [Actinobacteria bacterium]|nr:hypothetical protein [Actinomycetota bacterium]